MVIPILWPCGYELLGARLCWAQRHDGRYRSVHPRQVFGQNRPSSPFRPLSQRPHSSVKSLYRCDSALPRVEDRGVSGSRERQRSGLRIGCNHPLRYPSMHERAIDTIRIIRSAGRHHASNEPTHRPISITAIPARVLLPEQLAI